MADRAFCIAEFLNQADEIGDDAQLLKCLEVYEDLESIISKLPPSSSADQLEYLMQAQSLLISASISLPAVGIDGVLYKLALWYSENLEVAADASSESKADSLACSAFRDLARLLSVSEIQNANDHG
jgi:hypothetical protein